jgi:hypothetical protein
MNNPHWTILALTIIVFLIFIAIVILLTPKHETGQPYISCIPPLTSLETISGPRFVPCYRYGTNIRSGSYYDSERDWTLLNIDHSLIPAATEICLEVDTKNSSKYNDCLSILGPRNCSDPSTPVARLGSDIYYVIGFGKVSCFPKI